MLSQPLHHKESLGVLVVLNVLPSLYDSLFLGAASSEVTKEFQFNCSQHFRAPGIITLLLPFWTTQNCSRRAAFIFSSLNLYCESSFGLPTNCFGQANKIDLIQTSYFSLRARQRQCDLATRPSRGFPCWQGIGRLGAC